MDGGMDYGCGSLDERAGVADPLIAAPAEAAVVERAEVFQQLPFYRDRLAGRNECGQLESRRDWLGAGAGIRDILRMAHGGQRNRKKDNQFPHRFISSGTQI